MPFPSVFHFPNPKHKFKMAQHFPSSIFRTMKSFAFFLSLFFFFSCSDQIPTAKNKIDYAHLTYYPNSQKTDKKLTIDSIVIPLAAEDILSSMSGSFFCHQDTLFFADSQLASLLLFTADGHYIGNRLNKGKGPNEIQGIHTFTPTKNDKYIGLDESGNIYIFNTSWKKSNNFRSIGGVNGISMKNTTIPIRTIKIYTKLNMLPLHSNRLMNNTSFFLSLRNT